MQYMIFDCIRSTLISLQIWPDMYDIHKQLQLAQGSMSGRQQAVLHLGCGSSAVPLTSMASLMIGARTQALVVHGHDWDESSSRHTHRLWHSAGTM